MFYLAEITLTDLATLAAIIGAMQALVVMGDRLWGKKKSSVDEQDTKVMHDQVKALYRMHSQYDKDGVPMWYVPRSWADTQKDIVETQRNISETMHAVAKTLERIERNMEKAECQHKV